MAIIISRTIHGNNVKNEEKRPDLMANPAVDRQTLEQVSRAAGAGIRIRGSADR